MNKAINVKAPLEIQKFGIDALIRELGVVGTINFIQLYDRGSGDYTKERHAYFEGMSVDDIAKVIASK